MASTRLSLRNLIDEWKVLLWAGDIRRWNYALEISLNVSIVTRRPSLSSNGMLERNKRLAESVSWNMLGTYANGFLQENNRSREPGSHLMSTEGN